jgi:hypothetical protein
VPGAHAAQPLHLNWSDPMPKTRATWDNLIALSYAAEQLFIAGQLLTSDTVPVQFAVQQVCDRHLTRLKQHRNLLPSHVNTWIAECLEGYARMREAGQFRIEYADQLAASIRQLLDEVRLVLNRLTKHVQAENLAA